MRFFPASLLLFLGTAGCADILGFGDGGSGGSASGGGGTGAATATGGTATGGGGSGATGGSATGGGGTGGSATGGTGGATGGTGGASTNCIPGTEGPCYDGPSGTEGAGACKSGSRTCQMDGTWGACAGQVTPSVELCGNAMDESCDGVLTCSGGHRWSRRFGTTAADAALAVTVDRDGNTIVVGETSGKLDLGQPSPQAQGSADLFVVKLDPAGEILWGNTFGSTTNDRGNAVVTDAGGNIYVAGQGASISFPAPAGYASDGTPSGLVMKLSPAGDVLWARAILQGGANDTFADIAALPGGGVVVVGSYSDTGALTATFGGLPLPKAGNTSSVILAALTDDGAVDWVKGYGDMTSDQTGASVTVDSAGIIVLTVDLQGTIDFEGGLLGSMGGRDFAVAALDGNAQGDHLWSARFGDVGDQRPPLVRAMPDNSFVLAMPLVGTVNVGGGPLQCIDAAGGVPCAAGDVDLVVWKWKLNAGVMSVAWQKHTSEADFQSPTGLAVDGAGNVLVSGVFKNQVEINAAAGPLFAPAPGGRFAFKLGTGGGSFWQRAFGGTADMPNADTAPAFRLAVDPTTGRVSLAGGFNGAVDLGGGPLQATPTLQDILVAGLLP